MLNHTGTQKLTTARLTLRRFAPADAQAMFDNWASDASVTKYLSWETHPSPDFTRELIAKWILEYENPEYYHWVIEFDGTIVGGISLHDLSNRAMRCELGYCIGSKWWNQGVATEAARAVIGFAFEKLGAHRVWATHDVANAASGRVMQKAGMTREGILRQHARHKGGAFYDMVCCGVLREQWQKARRD